MEKIKKSLSVLNKVSFLAQTLDKGKAATIGYVVPLEVAIESIKNITKPEWNFPEQNQIPVKNKSNFNILIYRNRLQLNILNVKIKEFEQKIKNGICIHFSEMYLQNRYLEKYFIIEDYKK
jgi:hypothetical protein